MCVAKERPNKRTTVCFLYEFTIVYFRFGNCSFLKNGCLVQGLARKVDRGFYHILKVALDELALQSDFVTEDPAQYGKAACATSQKSQANQNFLQKQRNKPKKNEIIQITSQSKATKNLTLTTVNRFQINKHHLILKVVQSSRMAIRDPGPTQNMFSIVVQSAVVRQPFERADISAAKTHTRTRPAPSLSRHPSAIEAGSANEKRSACDLCAE